MTIKSVNCLLSLKK